ncbi:AAA family ATPase [Kribbella sandramycini]|uniref:AAA family ATPase n=1 Tax=Kribbella sandramycini TaxID=60450 RepID=A0A7Y4L0P3_9ACTN|nr:AAA family ATPase [Kribbella sandramycini]MBB6564474.1 DNA helicase IV [Kribbella sandramycini]NOL42178.1 AAA family ATPase [Kribbella sandramycini]
MPSDASDTLQAEKNYLKTSRAALAQMREKTGALEIHSADRVNQEFLKAAIWRRMKELEDDPEVPLFFGRLDYVEPAPETFHIGRRHVNDALGEPLVVDWRADISVPFYRASKTEPMGIGSRRRFGFTHGEMTAFEDEDLTSTAPAEQHSDILDAEIERPRSGPMRDIVATIQPEQDVIVRSGVEDTICVQGAPGTGKTAVGLHRAAYLLYAYRDQLSRAGVLVVGPNASFLRYIGDVLPALGEIEAKQTTVEELVAHVRVSGPGSAAVDVLKGDARMAEVLHRAVWSQVQAPKEALVVPRGSHRWRVSAYDAEELVAELRTRGVRYGAGRTMLPQRLAHAVLLRMEAAGDSPDDRVQDAVARSRPVKQYAEALWPAVDPAKLLFRLFTEPELLAEHADGILTAEEQQLLVWEKAPRSAGAAKWSVADATLIDEIADLVDRTPSLGHVVLDEAQDLSAMQLRAVGRRCSTGSMTVLGDIAQGTTPWATPSWSEALKHLGKSGAHTEELTAGFRVPGQVIEYAAQLLPVIAPHLTPPTAVRRARGELSITRVDDSLTAAVTTVSEVSSRPGSIGLIVPDAVVPAARKALQAQGLEFAVLGDEDDADAHLDVVPASLAKGLEFDHVVLVEPAGIVAGEADERTGLRRLYVCLTRAVTSLAVLHREDLPAVLEAARPA